VKCDVVGEWVLEDKRERAGPIAIIAGALGLLRVQTIEGLNRLKL
jgi:hypothetical protein